MFGFATKEDVRQLEANAKTSFSSVKSDTDLLWQWVTYLHAQQQGQSGVLDGVLRKIEQVPTKESIRSEVASAVEGSPVFERLMERVRHVEHRVDELNRVEQKVHVLETGQKDWFEQLKQLNSQVQEIGTDRRQNVVPRTVPETVPGGSRLREKVARLATRNSKDAIKQSILNLVRLHGQITGVALRESIVHEQGLCSKSSFYRLLEELEEGHEITVVDEGKEKRYLWGGARAKKVRTDD